MDLSPEDLTQLNLEKMLLETPALWYVSPNSADDYERKFPGFPPQFYAVLAEAGVPPAQKPHFTQHAGVGLGRRSRKRHASKK